MSMPGTIGPYRIERELARGGMRIVYLAHDTRLNRATAITAATHSLFIPMCPIEEAMAGFV